MASANWGRMIFGIYRHFKGGYYLVLGRVWNANNLMPWTCEVLYMRWFTFYRRSVEEFFGGAYAPTPILIPGGVMGETTTTPRFKKVFPWWTK